MTATPPSAPIAPTAAPSASPEELATDRAALVALYNATDGANWANNDKWLSDAPIGGWYGVTTDGGGRVSKLRTEVNQLSGPIPPELGSLTNLTVLLLHSNQLTGPVPPELGDLANLQEMSLSGNDLSGPIPPELGGLANLTALDLIDNQLSGTIPPELGNLTNLQRLHLEGNQLSGTIPPELGNLANLVLLSLSSNQLTGSIPPEFDNLTNLEWLNLSENQLSGCVPAGLQDVLNNDFSELDLPFCGQADQAKTATATPTVATVEVVEVTTASPELLATEKAALVAFYNATNGENWRLNNNWLSEAPVGEWVGVTTDSIGRVTGLDLNNFQLTGPIPAELGTLTSLRSLVLFANQLAGPIPPELGKLGDLRMLDLTQNRLTGPIPPELGDLTSLTGLFLHINQLIGEIPPELGDLINLQEMTLSGNEWIGCIPSGLEDVRIFDLSSLAMSFCSESAGDDQRTERDVLIAVYQATGGWTEWKNRRSWLTDKPLGEWYGVTTDPNGSVTALDLSGNQLRGFVPPELGDLTSLRSLDLSGNQLFGDIPLEWSKLVDLQSLRLAGNGFAGCIPSGLRQLDVPDNDLSELGLPFCESGTPRFVAVPADRVGGGESEADRAALVSLYNATGGANWKNNDNWLSDRPIWEWFGVRDHGRGSVTTLNLFENRLTGMVPPELGNLTSLKLLVLAGNDLTGTIPPELGDLRSLQGLYLYGNRLTGCIPSGLQAVPNSDIGEVGLPYCAGPVVGDVAGDRAALVALYNSTNGTNWANNSNWLSEAPLGQWYGVTTDASGRVTELELKRNNLTGTIPADLGGLNSLKLMLLSNNDLSGAIPPELGALVNLQGMDLQGNRLTGPIPPELGDLGNLESLLLRGNQLAGCIPTGFRDGPFIDLGDLALPYCDVPAGGDAGDRAALVALYNATDGANWKNNDKWLSEAPIGEWHGVKADASGRVSGLDLEGNQLAGTIPPELGQLVSLKLLNLGNNQLNGPIPPELGNFDNLQILSLHGNQFGGTIPPELGNIPSLVQLHLTYSQLNGPIPPELGNLTGLRELGLAYNQLSGPVPPELGNLINLYWLHLGSNQLSGPIPPELGNLTNLGEALVLSENRLSGPIPPELGNLASLRALSLQHNQLTGMIPPELGNLASLKSLGLSGNELSGCIPAGLKYVTNNDLSKLGLPFCAQPDRVESSADRAALVALYNATDGANWKKSDRWLSEAPIGVWQGVETDSSGRVTELKLNYTALSGTIPPELGNLTHLQTLIIHGSDQLTGPIPPELSNLTNLQVLSLTENGLSGAIPPELSKLTNLRQLSLQHNQLTGTIPPELENLNNLTGLSLAGNQFSGCIPSVFEDLQSNDFFGVDLPFCSESVVGNVTADRDALVSLYNATDGANWKNNDKWLSEAPIGEWYGVTTDASGRVTELILQFNRLNGEVPPELENLTNLTALFLTGNQLSGCIPSGLRVVQSNDFDKRGLPFC